MICNRRVEFDGVDDVHRRVSLCKRFNGVLQLTWETYWQGIDKLPLKTEVCLSMDGLNATLSLLGEFHQNPNSFKEPEEVE